MTWVAEQLAGLSLEGAPPPAVSSRAAAPACLPACTSLCAVGASWDCARTRELTLPSCHAQPCCAGAAQGRGQVPGTERCGQAVVPRRRGARLRGRPGALAARLHVQGPLRPHHVHDMPIAVDRRQMESLLPPLTPHHPLLLPSQTAPKYDVLFMDFGNREHITAAQVGWRRGMGSGGTGRSILVGRHGGHLAACCSG